MSTGIEIDVNGLPSLRRFLTYSSDLRTKELLGALGALVITQTVQRITEDKTAPDGTTWPPLSDPYRRLKERGGRDFPASSGGLLELRGYLRESIEKVVSGDGLEVGSNLDYAATHQYGDARKAWGKHDAVYPARPFLGLSKDDADEIEELTSDYIAGRLKVK